MRYLLVIGFAHLPDKYLNTFGSEKEAVEFYQKTKARTDLQDVIDSAFIYPYNPEGVKTLFNLYADVPTLP